MTLGGERDLSRLHVIVEGASARVVGVMPRAFEFPGQTDLWGPRELEADDSGRTAHGNSVVARLQPGVPLERAASEMNGIAAQLKQRYGNDDDATGASTMRLQDALVSQSRGALLLLLGAVGLVLLIACANVAATMLARGEERRLELAVRAALGAGRGRLVRQLIVESVVLGMIGATAGLLLAGWLVRVLQSVEGAALPPSSTISMDWRVLAFTLALGILTPLLFGLVPAVQASRPHLRGTLAEGGRSGAAPARAGVRSVLVGLEVAVALMLLVGAALLIRSFVNVMSVDPGFDPRGVVTAHVAVPATATRRPTGPRSSTTGCCSACARCRASPPRAPPISCR